MSLTDADLLAIQNLLFPIEDRIPRLEDCLQKFEERVDERFNTFEERVNERFNTVDENFDALFKRDEIREQESLMANQQLSRIEERVSNLEPR